MKQLFTFCKEREVWVRAIFCFERNFKSINWNNHFLILYFFFRISDRAIQTMNFSPLETRRKSGWLWAIGEKNCSRQIVFFYLKLGEGDLKDVALFYWGHTFQWCPSCALSLLVEISIFEILLSILEESSLCPVMSYLINLIILWSNLDSFWYNYVIVIAWIQLLNQLISIRFLRQSNAQDIKSVKSNKGQCQVISF